MDEKEIAEAQTPEGIVSLFLGVLGIIFSIVVPLPFVGLIGLILGFIAIYFGNRSWKKKNRFGLVGFILGVISVLLFILILVTGLMMLLFR